MAIIRFHDTIHTVKTSSVEVYTGLKWKPEPGPYPRSSDPTRATQLNLEPKPKIFFPLQRIAKKKKKAAFYDCMQRSVNKETDSSRLGHFMRQNKKTLTVMKVCQHQVQQSHTYAKFMNVVWTIILPPCKLWSFLSVKVCLHSLANQTQRCSVVRSYLFELARERERERGMKVARACEPASARLSLQATRLSFKKQRFIPSLQRNKTLRVSSLSKLFY